ncbi:MAG TPA: glycosyltransferase, partial [Baekduia sp.]|nr:glycosyltransferase [Baekduia sp.]
METPLVSICVPARDHAPFVGEALASALGQDVELEVLVGDDASCDGTAGVVASLGDPRVRLLRHGRRIGVAANRDRLRAAARGRYVAWLDADDAYEPGGLIRQVALLEEQPGVGLVHGRALVVDEHGERLPDRPGAPAGDRVEAGAVAFVHLLASNEIATSTVVVRRSADAHIGPTPRLPSSSDWAMWLRLALHGDVAFTAAPVARYRQHHATISRATADGARLRCDVAVTRTVLRRDRARLPDPARARATASAALCAKAVRQAGDHLTAGRRVAASRALALAVRLA